MTQRIPITRRSKWGNVTDGTAAYDVDDDGADLTDWRDLDGEPLIIRPGDVVTWGPEYGYPNPNTAVRATPQAQPWWRLDRRLRRWLARNRPNTVTTQDGDIIPIERK